MQENFKILFYLLILITDVGIHTVSLGEVVDLFGSYALGLSGSTRETIISLPIEEFRSAKAIVGISSDTNNFIQVNELSFVVDNFNGTDLLTDDVNVNIIDYGKIVSNALLVLEHTLHTEMVIILKLILFQILLYHLIVILIHQLLELTILTM